MSGDEAIRILLDSLLRVAAQFLSQFVLVLGRRTVEAEVGCLLVELRLADISGLVAQMLGSARKERFGQFGSSVRTQPSHAWQDLGLLLLDMVSDGFDQLAQGVSKSGEFGSVSASFASSLSASRCSSWLCSTSSLSPASSRATG